MANVKINLVPNSGPRGQPTEYTAEGYVMKRGFLAADVQLSPDSASVVAGQAVAGERVTLRVPYDVPESDKNKSSTTTVARSVDVVNAQPSLSASVVEGQAVPGETVTVKVPYDVPKPGEMKSSRAAAVGNVDLVNVKPSLNIASVVGGQAVSGETVTVRVPYDVLKTEENKKPETAKRNLDVTNVQSSPGTAAAHVQVSALASLSVPGKPVELRIPYKPLIFDQSTECKVMTKDVHDADVQPSPGCADKSAGVHGVQLGDPAPRGVPYIETLNFSPNARASTGVEAFAPVSLRIPYRSPGTVEIVPEGAGTCTFNSSSLENVNVTDSGPAFTRTVKRDLELPRGDNVPITIATAFSLDRPSDQSCQSARSPNTGMEITQVVTAEVVRDVSVTYQTALDTVMEGRRRFSGHGLSESIPRSNHSLHCSHLPTYVSTHSLYGRNSTYTGTYKKKPGSSSSLVNPSYSRTRQPSYSSLTEASMSRYSSGSSSYDRQARTYQSTRSTKTSDVSSRSYDSPSRRYDTSTRSYDSPSRLSQPRSGQSSRSSSGSSSVSDSNRGDTRQSSSGHTPASSQTHTSLGAHTRLPSSYGSAAGRRGLRSTSGDSTQNGRSVGESPRLTRAERDEKTKSDVSSTESERKRFGYSSARPISHPSGELQNEKENSRGVSSSGGKVSALDLVAEKFGGIGLRRSLREKPDDDRSRFGSAVTRRSARNVSGEVSEKKDWKETSNVSRTQKTVITESGETPMQLRGREIQRLGNVQVASRIENLKKSTQQNENKDRFGLSAARRSLRETNNVAQSAESALSEREGRSGVSSTWQSKFKPTEKPDEQSSEPRKSHRQFGSSALEDTALKRTEKSEAFGESVLKRRIQKYSGQSKSSGAMDEILAAEQKHKDVPQQETTMESAADRSDVKVQNQKSFERSIKTPADDFLRRAEMRSSLRQHRRDVAASAEQTLSGDVFKRSSLRSTLPLRKDSNNDSFERSDASRSLRKIDTFKAKTDVAESDNYPTEPVHPSVTQPEVSDDVVMGEDEVFKVSSETERPFIKTKVSIEAQATDRFGKPAWRKALRSREERPMSGNLEDKIPSPDVTPLTTAEPPAPVAEKFFEDSQSHSMPNRSRIPQRSDSDSSVPDSYKASLRASAEIGGQKTPSRLTMKSGKSGTENLDQGKQKLEANLQSNLPTSSVAAPGTAIQDILSIGESLAETPSESREDRIKRYKAERRKQLAHLTERFQDSPASKHFIKTEESKEEKSKDGLLPEMATPQKFMETETALSFESQAGVASQQEEVQHPTQEPQIFKRPRSDVEPAGGQEEFVSKRPKSDEEESAKVVTDVSRTGPKSKVSTARKAIDAASRSSRASSRSQRNPPIQIDTQLDAIHTKAEQEPVVSTPAELTVTDTLPHSQGEREPAHEPQLATLKYTVKDEVMAVPETAGKDLDIQHGQSTKATTKAVKDSEAFELTGKNVGKKIAEVKPFRQEPAEERSRGSVTLSPLIQSPVSDEQTKRPGEPGAPVIEEQKVVKEKPKVEIVMAKKVPEKEEIVRVVRSMGKPVTQTTAPSEEVPAQVEKQAPVGAKMGTKEMVKTNVRSETVDKKTAVDTVKPSAKLTSANITGTKGAVSSLQSQVETAARKLPTATGAKADVTKVTSKQGTEMAQKETLTADVAKSKPKQLSQQAKKDISGMKGKEAKVTATTAVSQEPKPVSSVTVKKEDAVKKTPDLDGQTVSAVASAKLSRDDQQPIPSQSKPVSSMKEATTEAGPAITKVVAERTVSETSEVQSQTKKVVASKELQEVNTKVASSLNKDTEQVEPQVDSTSDLKTPVKTLQQQQPPAAKTPESPDNLDELLRRNQKYLEEGVKKKLMRQQHVASSSSSEAEKAADGSLVPPGGKKKRISPLMRRRIKERSKSRERAEAEKEETKAEQQISAAELLASPEQGRPGEVTLDSEATKFPPLVDVFDASKKPSDSDSTLASVVDSASVSATGSEEHTKKKRKDKTSVRKSQLNVSATVDLETEGLTSQGDNLDLETAGTPRGQRLTERNKTTPVTPEEVQQATEQIARQREEVKAWTIPEETVTSSGQSSVTHHMPAGESLARRELRLLGPLPSRVSSALSKFQGTETKTEAKPKTDDLSKSTRPFARGRDFSTLIQKFSSSDSSEETDRLRRGKIAPKKLDLPPSFSRSGATSSDESNTEADRPRRTPERTGSLKERARQFERGINTGAKTVQRSSSFKVEPTYKSDFMRKAQLHQQQQQSDKPSEELSAALNRRNKTSAENGDSSQKNGGESRIELLEAKLSMPKEDTKVEEVIKDQELINVLKSRRKASDAEYHDALEELEKLENGSGKSKSTEAEIKEVITDEEVAKVLQARRRDTDSKTADQDEVFEDSVESLDSKQTDTSTKRKTSSRSGRETAESVEVSKAMLTEKSAAVSTGKAKTKKEDSSELKEMQTSVEKLRNNCGSAKQEAPIQKPEDNSTGKPPIGSEVQSKTPNVVVKQTSLDKPVRGILKRSSSSDYASRSQESGPIIDPQLAAVLQGRKKMVEGSEVTDEKRENELDKRNVIRQEIAQTEIHKSREDDAEEEERPLSIAERIFMMENRIEEAKSCPVTPHTRSGVNTPRSRARSGASTPRRQSVESLEEDVRPRTNPLLVSDKHLMAKLEKMAEKEQRTTEKRQRHPRRSRDDWRTRTLPVTLEEIQEADSLESVSSFRGLVRRKATINIFEQLKEQDRRLMYSKKTEFPQPFRKEKKSRRSSRSKTAPITAAELGSIPEGNTLLDPLRHLCEPLSTATSKADSGILSGSDIDRDSIQSDSSRSLEMELPEDDPTRQSVSARMSIFRQLEEQATRVPEKEKPKNRSIGAKRMIEKKKRERSRTQPITEDEVKTASEFADTDKAKSSSEKSSVNKTPSKDGSSDSDDELSRLSIAEKLKLFSQKPEEKALPPPPRSNAPVSRKRKGKLVSRFNTQPITTEEIEKAYKISPLALSMAKPPDSELLRSLPIADQIEMMAQHAKATLSQPSSRAGSRAGSQPGSRRSSVGTESTEAEDTGILKTSENKDPQEVRSILKHDGRKSSDSEIRGILKDAGKDSAEPRGILKHGDSEGEITSAKSPDEPSRGILKHTDSSDSQKGHKSALRRDSKGKSEGDLPRSILKRDSLEENKVEPDKGVLKKSRSQDFKESHEIRGILKKTASSEVRSASCEVTSEDSDVTSEFVVTREETRESRHVETASNQTNGTEAAGAAVEKSVSQTIETRKMSKIKNEAVARRRSREARKAEAERYHTQPADTGTPEKTPEQRKMKYGASRHHTQPITPEEKEAAEASGTGELSKTNSGSIAERLNQLKKSGEEDWKRRVRPELGLPEDVQMRVKKGPLLERPHSIADRLSQLGESQMKWTSRVEEKDAKAFTVEGKQNRNGIAGDSPVSTRKRRLPKRELSFGKGDSAPEDTSPLQSPSRERIPIPKELISEGPPMVSVSKSSSSSSSKTVITKIGADEDREVEDAFRTMTVELPSLGEDSFNTFFSQVQGLEEEKIDVSLDDFDHLFLKAEDVLTPARRIRPKRRHIAQNRNPLKTMSVEIEQTYTEFRTGVAEMELKRIKREGFAKESSSAQVMLAEAAVKGLQSTESFNIELRKTKDSKAQTPGGTDKFLPYKDLMLLHIKGRRHVQTRLVEPHATSVNKGDSYILIRPDRVVNWNGKFSNVIEKARAADIAQFVSQKKDLGYRESSPPIIVEDEKMRHVANKNFWSFLEGDEECQECGPPDEDEAYEAYIVETNMVYKVCNNTLVPYEEYWGKIPKVEMLKPDEVLVFDFGSELYVWQGNQVSMEQRRMGMKLATQLWDKGYDYSMCPINPITGLRDEEEGGLPNKSSQRPSWAIFGKVNQNMETTLFKEKFFDWPESSRFTMRSKTPESFALKQVECDLKPYDAKLLIPVNKGPVTMVFEGSHVGRGDKWVEDMDGLRREFDILTLDVIVWHVLEYDHSKLPTHSYGQFHDGDTYVVRWQYMITASGMKTLKGQAARHSLTGRERCAYFFWQGHNSTVNEKGASALMTVELDEERGPQVRVSQGKEPPCFLNLFEGRTIVHIGKREEAETNTQGAYRLYLVRNELENEMCLMEVPLGAENLRSRTSFLLLNVKTGFLYIWHGAKSPSYTRKLAVGAANKLKEKCPLEVGLHSKANVTITELEEGSEKSEFWSAMRTRDRKLYHSLLKGKPIRQTPRLFYMNSVAGVFEALEILNPTRCHDLITPMPFLQSDLYKASQPGLFLLDNHDEVYLWQGWWPEGDEDSENVHTGSAQARFNTDRHCAMQTTLQYCQEKCPSKPPTAYLVFAGLEPLAFTNLFPTWTVEEEAKESSLRDGRKPGETILVEELLAKLTQSQYTLDELKERPLPEGVDPLKLETYLKEEEFEAVLNMSKDDFYALPSWKQTKSKQKVGLF